MNIVDKILVDPITRGLKFFTKGGALVNTVEFASNDGSGGTAASTTYTTGSVAGPAGSQFVSVNSTDTTGNTTTYYKVNFQSPIRATDKISIEMSQDSGATWGETSGVITFGRLVANNTSYGIYLTSNDSTSVYVSFGNGGRQPGVTYAAAGASWAGVAAGIYRFRVRKASI